jgi:hypothetical protein
MVAELNYEERISWMAGNLDHPKLKEKIKETALQFKFTQQTVRKDISAMSPVMAASMGVNRPTLGDGLRSLCKVTKEDVMSIAASTHVYRKVIPQGQMIVIIGESNAGKTIIFEHVCGKIKGEVLYINMDIPSAHIPRAEHMADVGGYDLMCPDIKPGTSIDDVISLLRTASQSDEDLSSTTIVIDTLKKIVDVINKREARSMFQMLRALTGRGATIICLAHTNKFRGDDGWPIPEGTGDLRTDFDAVALLFGYVGDYGEVTSSLYWREQGWEFAKDRGLVEPMSWTIDKHNSLKVTELDEWIDTHALKQQAIKVKKRSDLIQDIYSLINGTPEGMNQSNVISHLHGEHSGRAVRDCLPTYVDKFWTVVIGGQNNANVYTAMNGVELPKG